MKDKPVNLIISDLKMPGIDGVTLFQRVRDKFPNTDFIMITAYATVEIAVESLKQGVKDFITKPFPVNEIRQKVAKLYSQWKIRQKGKPVSSAFAKLVGNSRQIRRIRDVIKKVATVDSPVLITGESGTGKELVTLSIHEKSGRSSGPFISVNCGALSASLLESELFGHEKGSFTGADKQHAGKFEQAEGGTLFLDEIGEMEMTLQVKLLRVLQEKKFQRVGGENFIAPNFRLLTATNRDLEAEVKNKTFRSDLFYRLNVVPVKMPALRERKKDIPDIVEMIIAEKCTKLQREIPVIKPEVMDRICAYSWPGNVRELENFLERTLIFLEGNEFNDEFLALGEDSTQSLKIPESDDLYKTLEKIEREMIIKALIENDGVKQKTARKLNIKPSTLYYRMEKLNIEDKDYK